MKKKKKIFEGVELDTEDYAKELDEIINERIDIPKTSEYTDLIRFMNRLESKILSKESTKKKKGISYSTNIVNYLHLKTLDKVQGVDKE